VDDGQNADNQKTKWTNIWKRVQVCIRPISLNTCTLLIYKQHLTLHPFKADVFILIDDTGKLSCNDPPEDGSEMHETLGRSPLNPKDVETYLAKAEQAKVARRHLLAEHKRIEAEREAAEAEARRLAAKRKLGDEEEVARKRREELARAEEEARPRMLVWLDGCKVSLQKVEDLKEFPYAPIVRLPCDNEECCQARLEKGPAWPGTCVHDSKPLLRLHPQHSLAWLKKARTMWHPDSKWVRAPLEVREVFRDRAREMFTIFGLTMDKLE